MRKRFPDEIVHCRDKNGKPIITTKITCNFGKYQKTHNKIRRIESLSKFDFKVKEPYRALLLHQLKKSREHLECLLAMLEVGVEK
jgi:hypothetical protein